MEPTIDQVLKIQNEIQEMIKEFTSIGLTPEQAKKAVIKVVRRNINELVLIDDVYMIGLKPRIEIYRKMILLIIER